MNDVTNLDNTLVVFQHQQIRRVLHNDEWWFSVIDVVSVLTESPDPANYWRVLKNRLKNEGSNETITICNGLKLQATDGKMRVTDCANAETMFRIIQSIPSPKAEPFKRWLAQVGYERVQEIEDPELATKRTRVLYKDKGYSDEWIEKRMRGIAVREELTDEWHKRGVKEGVEYAILTDEIAKATFGVKTKEHKALKALKKQNNLRDHMNDLELIFSMLGEASATAIARSKDTQGLAANKQAAKEGGEVAGNARKQLEQETGKPVVTTDNYLPKVEPKKGLNNGNKKKK